LIPETKIMNFFLSLIYIGFLALFGQAQAFAVDAAKLSRVFHG